MKKFGIDALRILTVTTTAARVENMIAMVKELTGGSNLFLFIDQQRLAASSAPEAEWISGKGEAVRLTD